MIDALRKAGFPGVEAVGDTVHARLWSSSVEFTATPEPDGWRLSVVWPLRATTEQIADWNARHPTAPMDIFFGETRVSMIADGDSLDQLHHWASVAELAVQQCIVWRRMQRAPGEGM